MKRLNDEKLRFNEEDHTYKVGKKKLQSVTEWVGKFFGEFDEDAISLKMAQKRTAFGDEDSPETFQAAILEEQQKILAEWKASRDEGTAVHKEIEDWINSLVEPKSEKAKAAVMCLLLEGFDGGLSEVRVYSENLGLAGTVDYLKLYGDDYTKPRAVLVDWKTNKEIRRGNRFQQTSGPVEHLHDSHLNKYSLQLSTYAYILEKEYGFLVDALYICHLTETGYKLIPVDFLKETVKEMIYSGKN